jgi:hypothetical protein
MGDRYPWADPQEMYAFFPAKLTYFPYNREPLKANPVFTKNQVTDPLKDHCVYSNYIANFFPWSTTSYANEAHDRGQKNGWKKLIFHPKRVNLPSIFGH